VGNPVDSICMRKAALLYNQRSGGGRANRRPEVEAALRYLQAAGVDASLTVTASSADAGDQARLAVAAGCDTVLACGGDGTIHDVIQGMAGSQAVLGVLPMGTANALAHDLALPLNPAKAAEVLRHAEPKRIALGRVELQGFGGERIARYFTVAVGIGVDAHLFYKLHSGTKQKLGMAAYYAKAWQLWFSHRMQHFAVQCPSATGTGNAQIGGQQILATEMLAVRIRNFGGVLRELAPGASLDRNDLRLVLCRTSNRLAYLSYVTRTLLGVKWNVPGVELVHSPEVRCDYAGEGSNGSAPPTGKVYVEADGELLGSLPAKITMVPDALTILVPRGR
jgi:diacylglycerol kinase (ATP)